MKTEIQLLLILLSSLLILGCDSCNNGPAVIETVEEVEPYTGPPFVVFFFDQEIIPPPIETAPPSYPDQTYTAQVFIEDKTERKLYGPYPGSTFPNNKTYEDDKPKTIDTGTYLFLNYLGHKGMTKKGLNLVIYKNGKILRETPALTKSGIPKSATEINVHYGTSNKGNPDSRGSRGCLTIHPDSVDAFMNNFDWEAPNLNTGTSEGIVHVKRSNPMLRNEMINKLKSMYD